MREVAEIERSCKEVQYLRCDHAKWYISNHGYKLVVRLLSCISFVRSLCVEDTVRVAYRGDLKQIKRGLVGQLLLMSQAYLEGLGIIEKAEVQ
jgi:hypothetical protein